MSACRIIQALKAAAFSAIANEPLPTGGTIIVHLVEVIGTSLDQEVPFSSFLYPLSTSFSDFSILPMPEL